MSQRVARVVQHLRQLGSGTLDRRILFLHIPKCGGTSVADAIGAAYGWRLGRQSRSVRLDPEASWRGSRLSHNDLFEFREKLLLYELGRSHLRFVSGHYPLSETALEAFGEDWDVVTVLRDPVDRWFSEYFYNRHKSSRYFAHEQGLSEYVGSHTGVTQARTYVRWFSGELSDDWSEARVDRALRNMDRLALVGVLEQLDLFREAFQDRFGVKLRIPKLNPGPWPEEQRQRAISPALRLEVEELCKDDLRLYRHAVEGCRA